MKHEKIGSHRVFHSDIMTREFINHIKDEKFDIMYSDPPWGEGNLKFWQTMNYKATGTPRNEVNLERFLRNILLIASTNVDGPILIEYGKRWHDYIINLAKEFGLVHNGSAEMLYNSGKKKYPLDLHVFSKKPITLPQGYLKSVYHTVGITSLKKAIVPFAKEGLKIIDPCCGMGYTAQIAVDNGMEFTGNELNSVRLNKTIIRLGKTLKV